MAGRNLRTRQSPAAYEASEGLFKQVLLAVPRTIASLPRVVAALTGVLEQLVRLAGPNGELTQLLGAAAQRLSGRTHRSQPPQLPANPDGPAQRSTANSADATDWFV